jgi:hypothetical protein
MDDEHRRDEPADPVLIPQTSAPSARRLAKLSRNSHASVVQPGVSSSR